jgi:hypothetical protein
MAKMSRMLALVHLLADTAEGLTLNDMTGKLGFTDAWPSGCAT